MMKPPGHGRDEEIGDGCRDKTMMCPQDSLVVPSHKGKLLMLQFHTGGGQRSYRALDFHENWFLERSLRMRIKCLPYVFLPFA